MRDLGSGPPIMSLLLLCRWTVDSIITAAPAGDRCKLCVDEGLPGETAVVTFGFVVGSERGRGKVGMLDGCDFVGGDGRSLG